MGCFFRVTDITLHLDSLNKIFLLLLQSDSEAELAVGHEYHIDSGVIPLKALVSSAYNGTFVLCGTTFGISFINSTNSIGPIILPWGTPEETSAQSWANPFHNHSLSPISKMVSKPIMYTPFHATKLKFFYIWTMIDGVEGFGKI